MKETVSFALVLLTSGWKMLLWLQLPWPSDLPVGIKWGVILVHVYYTYAKFIIFVVLETCAGHTLTPTLKGAKTL